MTTDDIDLQVSPDELATDADVPEAELPIDEPELEALEPFPKWDKRYKDVFAELGNVPERGRAYQEAMRDMYSEQQGYATKVEQERAQYYREAQRAQQWDQVIQPYHQMAAQAGTTPDNLVRQALGLTMQLQQDPRATIQRLAQMANLDLGQLQQDQPYVDPQVKALQDQLNQMQQMTVQQQQRQAHEYQQRAMAEISHEIGAFAEAKDASGNPLHPHLETVQPLMAELIYGREAQRRNNPGTPSMSLKDAYERACKLSPDVTQAADTERKVQEAAKRAALAKKETDSAKRTTGKRAGKDVVAEDIKETIRKSLHSQAA